MQSISGRGNSEFNESFSSDDYAYLYLRNYAYPFLQRSCETESFSI